MIEVSHLRKRYGDTLALDAALSFVFHRSTDAFSEMTLSFTRYDNSFYLVSFNGEERLLVNRNAVTDLVDMVLGW